jgi:hypothetical protein
MTPTRIRRSKTLGCGAERPATGDAVDSAAMVGATVTGRTPIDQRGWTTRIDVFPSFGELPRDLVGRGGFRLRHRDVRESDVDDLIDGVDRFAFAGAATENEDAGHELIVDLAVVGLGRIGCVFFFAYKARDADGLAAVAAQDTAGMVRGLR